MLRLACTRLTVPDVPRVVRPSPSKDYTRVYISHSRESSQAVHTHSYTIRTLFAQSSHRIHTAILSSHTIRTLFAHYSHGRTLFARSHTIRTLFARFTHYSRHRHTNKFTFAPVRTPVTLFAPWGRACSQCSHSVHTVFAKFTFVNV